MPILHFLLWALSPHLVQGEDTPTAAPKPKGGRVAWIAYTTLPDEVENPVKILAGKDITRLTLSMQMPSGPVRIPADGILRLIKEVPDPREAGKTTHVTLAQAAIPENVNKALVILVTLPKPKGDLLFASKVQNLADFKGGDWLFLNLTSAEIGVQLGADKLAIKPGGTEIQRLTNLTKATSMPVSLNYRLPPAKEWQHITASTVAAMPSRREICIFSMHPEYGNITYNGITFPVAPDDK